MNLYRLDILLRQILPAFFILFFMILNRVISEGWGYWEEISPWIVLMCVWYWAIFRPSLLPVWFIFIVGFLEDFYSYNTPYGTHSVILILSYAILLSQRRVVAVQNFMVGWLMFAVFSFVAIMLRWAIISLFNTHLFSVKSSIASFMLTVSFYPLIFILLTFVSYMIAAKDKDAV
ncbi:MAG: rod shape-determining protein MreD [Alphaproteobacteria bacterium]